MRDYTGALSLVADTPIYSAVNEFISAALRPPRNQKFELRVLECSWPEPRGASVKSEGDASPDVQKRRRDCKHLHGWR